MPRKPPKFVAFWGVETNFGGFLGNHDVVETLANLGHGGNRQRFFTEELLGALILVDRGLVPRGFKGSYAGAFGHAQFMPTSYIQNAVDFDGDGRKDLIHSVPDVLASTANFLAGHGWQRGAGWQPGSANYGVIAEWNKADVYDRTIAEMADQLSGR